VIDIKKKIIALTFILLSLMCLISFNNVFAEISNANVSVNLDTRQVNVTGSVSQPGEEITMMLFVGDTTPELQDIIFNDMIKADSNGNFSYSFLMNSNAISGKYSVSLKGEIGDAELLTFNYFSMDYVCSVIAEINHCIDTLEMQAIIEGNSDLFTIPASYYTLQDRLSVFLNMFKSAYSYVSLDEINYEIRCGLILAQIYEVETVVQLEEIISVNSDILNIDMSIYYSFNSSQKMQILQQIQSNEFQSINNFKSEFIYVCKTLNSHQTSPGSGGGGSTSNSHPVFISDVSLVEDGISGQLSFEASSISSIEESATIFVSLYDSNGILRKIKKINHNISSYNSCYVDMEYLQKNENDRYKYKIMVWDINMEPLSLLCTNAE